MGQQAGATVQGSGRRKAPLGRRDPLGRREQGSRVGGGFRNTLPAEIVIERYVRARQSQALIACDTLALVRTSGYCACLQGLHFLGPVL